MTAFWLIESKRSWSGYTTVWHIVEVGKDKRRYFVAGAARAFGPEIAATKRNEMRKERRV